MESQILATFILPLGGIIFIDLVLSGDNALVIGAAIVGIPAQWRKLALLLGGMVAILLRIFFTIFATFLLRINYLQTFGGLLVLWVTWRLLVEPKSKEAAKEATNHLVEKQNKTATRPIMSIVKLFCRLGRLIARARQPVPDRFLIAVLAIVITDVSTSLDNVIAIAALAHGQLIILGIGLVLSIIILLIGSAVVARLLERYPNLITLSGFVLAWIAGNLIVQDTNNYLPFIAQNIPFFRQYMPYASIPIYLLAFSFVIVAMLANN